MAAAASCAQRPANVPPTGDLNLTVDAGEMHFHCLDGEQARLQFSQQCIPALILHEAAGSSRLHLRKPASGGNPRKREGRPVRPEVEATLG